MNEFENEQKWRLSGLLEGNDGYDAIVLANNLEYGFNLLMGKKQVEKKEIQLKTRILLPIIVRLFNELNVKTIDIENLYENVSLYLNTNRFLAETNEEQFCDSYIKQFSDSVV